MSNAMPNNTVWVLIVKVPLTGGVSYVRARWISARKIGGWGVVVSIPKGGLVRKVTRGVSHNLLI